MSKFESIVRTGLQGLALDAREREEVVEELTGHLDELSAELRRSGGAESDVRLRVLDELGDWKRLRRKIQRSKEGDMTDRVKHLWLPGLLTAFLAFTVQQIIGRAVAWPRIVDTFGVQIVYLWQWELALIPIGAIGALASRLAGGSRRDRILSALSPSIIMLGLFVALLLVNSIVQPRELASNHGRGLAAWIVWMVLVPGVPSLCGALPFLFGGAAHNSEPPRTFAAEA